MIIKNKLNKICISVKEVGNPLPIILTPLDSLVGSIFIQCHKLLVAKRICVPNILKVVIFHSRYNSGE